jgi:uncharacterized metal-binding protein
MPSGPTHRAATAVLIVAAAPTIFILPPLDWLALEAGIASTLLASPDMDIHNRLGFIGDLLGFEAYRKLVPHRGGLHDRHWSRLSWRKIFALSHIPIIGTLPRVILLLLPLGIILSLFSALELINPWLFIHLWAGASLSDALHTLMDLFPYRRFKYRERQEILSGYKDDRMAFHKKRKGRATLARPSRKGDGRKYHRR